MSDGPVHDSSMERRTPPNMVVESVEHIWSGPLPPPAVLAHYEHILPGAADRIIAMAEKQLDHRQRLEHGAITANIDAQKRGVWLGFLIALIVVGGGIWIILSGHSTAGLVAIVSALTALVGAFVYGRKRQKGELERKNPKGSKPAS